MSSHGTRNILRRWLVAAALALLSVGANAQGMYTKDTTGYAASAVGNKVTVTGPTSSGGWRTTPGATPYTAGNIGFSVDRNGNPVTTWGSGSTKMPLPEGRQADINIKTPISRTAAAGAIMRFGSKLLFPISAAMALGDLLDELNVEHSFDPQKNRNVWAYLKDNCTVGDYGLCWEYSFSWSRGKGPTPEAAFFTLYVAPGEINEMVSCTPTTGCYYNRIRASDGAVLQSNAWANVGRQNVTKTSVLEPLTDQELADKIAAESGWPTSDAVRADKNAAALAEAIRAGETVAAGTPQVTGPATVQGPQTTTTTQTPSGTATTTTNTTYNITYQGSTITINNTTTSTTINPDGTTTTTTESSEKPAEKPEEEKEEECKVDESTGLPPADLKCGKFDSPEVEMPEKTENVSWSPFEFGFGSGSCPAPVTWSDSLGTHALEFTKICDVLATIVKPLVLLMAALAAAFIVLPRET